MFPYYIVRFKLDTRYLNKKSRYKFPYYIVRFKRYSNIGENEKIIPFPYYIVRFKQNDVGETIGTPKGFHTT